MVYAIKRGVNLGTRPTICAACPWLTANQGRRTKGGWYTKANLRRLWTGLRTGEAPGMTCHPTDPQHPAPDGRPDAVPPDGSDFHECHGAAVLMQREIGILEGAGSFARYRRLSQAPSMTVEGLFAYAERALFGDSILDSRPKPLAVELDQEVSRP